MHLNKSVQLDAFSFRNELSERSSCLSSRLGLHINWMVPSLEVPAQFGMRYTRMVLIINSRICPESNWSWIVLMCYIDVNNYFIIFEWIRFILLSVMLRIISGKRSTPSPFSGRLPHVLQTFMFTIITFGCKLNIF